MTHLLDDLGRASPVSQPGLGSSIAYTVDPDIFAFLQNFKSRTEFCDYKCPDVYNLPCFIIFECNIHIRNFVILIALPVWFLAMLGLCCGRGIWTFKCWLKYLMLFSGIVLFVWLIDMCIKGRRKNKRRDIKKRER